MRDTRPGSAEREALDLEQRLRETDRRGDTPDSADAVTWRPSTEAGGYHGWRLDPANINANPSLAIFNVHTVLQVDGGGEGKFARMTANGLVLNQPGEWRIEFLANSGGNYPGTVMNRLSWAGGPWSRTYGAFKDNWQSRRVDVASGGNVTNLVHFHGYVDPTQAKLPIVPGVAQSNQQSETVRFGLYLTAELLAVYDPITSSITA